MYIQNAYNILGINNGASKDDIKRAYKDIALTCHPDKLVHLQDDKEREARIEKFKEATIAYEMLMNNSDTEKYVNDCDWKEVWYKFFDKESIKETLVDIANHFIKSKIYPQSYYNPREFSSNMNVQQRHEISLEVSYNEILVNTKKKLRLVLVDINEPIFVDIYCGAFPQIVKEYTDDNDIEHEIIINLQIKKQDNWDHIISKSGYIDIITTADISWKEYLLGVDKNVEYIDGKLLYVYIPPFQKDYLEVPGKGLKGGSLIINLCLKSIDKEPWLSLPEKDKLDMIRILDSLA